ncbi:MAG: IS21 family transposase [Fibrobacterota bacterium]|nr:IS21 family transposase [Fibrobacterota bacterium]
MRRIKEALHLSLDKGLNQSQVAGALALARSTVQDYLHRADSVGLTQEMLATLSEDDLGKMLFRREQAPTLRPEPDCQYIHVELRKIGVTLQLLWEEYKKDNADGYGYTQYCERYRVFVRKLTVSMRQSHKAGEKAYVDYSGKKPSLVNRETGEVKPVEIFVMVFGASNYTYAEAQESQALPNWLGGHARAFAAFECVPHHIVPDCLKDAVIKSHLYDPDLNETYVEMCRHYGCAPLPARPLHPKDKAKVEVGVQVVQRWILARLRNRIFHTLDAINAAIFELTVDLNNRLMRHLGKTRLELFQTLDKPSALPLPEEPFRFYAWLTCKVGIDYCIQVDKHYYSVPYIHTGDQVGVRLYEKSVEIFLRGERIAMHIRSRKSFAHTILPEHMPERHKKHLAWTPHRLLTYAEKTGPNTAAVVKAILAGKPYVEMGYRPALGVMRLAESYGAEKMERVCAYALPRRLFRVAQLSQLLKMETGSPRPGQPTLFEKEEPKTVAHENLRGMDQYAGGEA